MLAAGGRVPESGPADWGFSLKRARPILATLAAAYGLDMAKFTRGFTKRESRVRASWLPPGQYDIEDAWPVLTAEATPRLSTDTWTFTVDGLVDQLQTWTWDQIHALPQSEYFGDIHCVTTWSKHNMSFVGVSVDTLFAAAGVEPNATC